jgi:hypothetical protein
MVSPPNKNKLAYTITYLLLVFSLSFFVGNIRLKLSKKMF